MKLATKRLFHSIFKRGHTFHSPHLSLRGYFAKSPEVRVVVSKKVTNSAVERNTLKRRLREIFKESGVSVQAVIYAKRGADALSFHELRAEALSLIHQLRE